MKDTSTDGRNAKTQDYGINKNTMAEQIILKHIEDKVVEMMQDFTRPLMQELARNSVKKWADIQVSRSESIGEFVNKTEINIVFVEKVLNKIKQEFVIKEIKQ